MATALFEGKMLRHQILGQSRGIPLARDNMAFCGLLKTRPFLMNNFFTVLLRLAESLSGFVA